MNSCRCYFPKLNISLSGLATSTTFSMIKQSLQPEKKKTKDDTETGIVDVDIECFYSVKPELLPQWLLNEMSQTDFEIQPRMFFHKDQVAVMAKDHQSIFCAILDLGKNRIKFITIAENEPDRGIFNPLLIILFREILNHSGYVLLHSAAVCFPGGSGAIIIGESGQGKTTTALSMVRNGAKLLGDDLTVLEIGEKHLTAYGVPEHLNLTEQTRLFFKEMAQTPSKLISRGDDLKKMVDPGLVYGEDCWVDQSPIHTIYFTKITKKGSFVRPLELSEVLEKLVISHGFCRDQATDADAMSRLLSISSMARAYELNTGSDPSMLGRWLLENQGIHPE